MPHTRFPITPGHAAVIALRSAAPARHDKGPRVSVNARAVEAVNGAVRRFAPADIIDEGVVRYAAHHVVQIDRPNGVARFYLLPDDADLRGLDPRSLIGSKVTIEADGDYRITKIRPSAGARILRAV